MPRHTNNPDFSVTVVKLAGYNGDDHFLCLKGLKGPGAGGLADTLPYYLNPFTGDFTVTVSDINGLYFLFFSR